MHDTDDQPTLEDRAALEALPRERTPGRLLEDRTVGALRARGLLKSSRTRTGWILAGLAASLAVFAAGFASGQWALSRRVVDSMLAAQQQTSIEAARAVQQTGSAYVTALAVLAQLADSSTDAVVEQGREVALAALYAAAQEVAALDPTDPVAALLRHELGRAGGGAAQTEHARRLVWF